MNLNNSDTSTRNNMFPTQPSATHTWAEGKTTMSRSIAASGHTAEASVSSVQHTLTEDEIGINGSGQTAEESASSVQPTLTEEELYTAWYTTGPSSSVPVQPTLTEEEVESRKRLASNVILLLKACKERQQLLAAVCGAKNSNNTD